MPPIATMGGMPVLTVQEIDLLIDAAAAGEESYTLPNGFTVKKPDLDRLMKLRKFRASQTEGELSETYAEFVDPC
jgi:hypothetical protein